MSVFILFSRQEGLGPAREKGVSMNRILCKYCYSFFNSQLRHHVCKQSKEVARQTNVEVKDLMHELVKEHKRTNSHFSEMLNVNPMFLMGRSYTDQEVLEILKGLGHVLVPEDHWTTCCNLPANEVYQNTVLTGNIITQDKPVSKQPSIDGIHANVVGATIKPLNPETPAIVSNHTEVDTLETTPDDLPEHVSDIPNTLRLIPDLNAKIDIDTIDNDLLNLSDSRESVIRPRSRKRIIAFSSDSSDSHSLADAKVSPDETTTPVISKRPPKHRFVGHPHTREVSSKRKRKNYKDKACKKSRIQDKGLYDAPDSYTNHEFMKGFTSYWVRDKAKSKNEARQHVNRMVVMLFSINQNELTLDSLTRENILSFYELQKDLSYKASTRSSYNVSLTNFIKYLLHFHEPRLESSRRDILKSLLVWTQFQTNIIQKEQRTEQRTKRTLDAFTNPPPVSEFQEVIHAGRGKAITLLKKAKTNDLGKSDVTYLNRYLSALMCYGVGHRPGVAINFQLIEFENARPPTKTEEHYSITVAEHKTADQERACVFLDEEQFQMFRDYNEFVRIPIIKRTASDAQRFFFLTYIGTHYASVSDGFARLQLELGIQVLNINQMRHSVESHNQHLPESEQTDVVHLLAHSKKIRNSHYRTHKVEHLHRGFKTVQKLASTDKNENTPKKPGKTILGKIKEKVLSNPSKVHVKSPSKDSIFDEYLERCGPVTRETSVPSVSKIISEYGLKKDKAKQIHDKIRYSKSQIIAKEVAIKIIKAEAKRLKITPENLSSAPQLPNAQVIAKYAEGKFVRDKDLKNAVSQVLNEMKYQVARTPDNCSECLKTQIWPNLVISEHDQRGRIVKTGADPIQKGSVVCDYHGKHLPKREGETRLAGYEDHETEGNYILFYKDPKSSKGMCIDACAHHCECHPDIDTFGRLVSHSAHSPNLDKKVKYINGNPYVLLIANVYIAPFTEVTFDYGVRRGENGTEINWLTGV